MEDRKQQFQLIAHGRLRWAYLLVHTLGITGLGLFFLIKSFVVGVNETTGFSVFLLFIGHVGARVAHPLIGLPVGSVRSDDPRR